MRAPRLPWDGGVPARLTILPPELAARPFTMTQARAAGLTPRALQGRAVRRLLRGVYVAADLEPSLALEVAAARLVLPAGCHPSGVTALQLLGIDLGPRRPLRFVGPVDRKVVRAGLLLSRVADPVCHAGPGSAAAAFCSAALTLDLVDLVAAGDQLVRRRLTSPGRLVAAAAALTGRGSVRARRAAALVCRRVDSVRETRLRLALRLAGLPAPEVNLPLGSEHWFIGTPDLTYQAYKVIGEYEGDQHRTDRRQWEHDIGRYEEFTAEGWTVIRVTSQRMRRPRAVVGRFHEALVAGGYRGPGPVFTAEWSRLFE